MNVAVQPGTYTFGLPLQIYRTPLEWLQAQCDGIVLLKFEAGLRWLLDIDGIAEMLALRDDAHAAEIAAARRVMVQRQHLVVPVKPKHDMENA